MLSPDTQHQPSRIKVLIGDDEKDILEMIQIILSSQNDLEVRCALSGNEALEIAREFNPDVVFLDYRMPDMNGLETTKCLLALYPTCQIILISGNAFDSTLMQKGVEAGIVGFLEKPIREQSLLFNIYTFANSRRRVLQERQYIVDQEKHFRSLFEQSNDAIIIHDVAGKIQAANTRASEMLGFTTEQFTRMTIGQIQPIAEYPHCPKIYEEHIQNGHGQFESIFQRNNGSLVEVEISCRIVNEQEGIIQCIARDISERKQMQAQILQQEKLASIGQLAAGIAHEVNNPTGFIMSNLNTFQEYIGDICSLLAEYRQLHTLTTDEVIQAQLIEIQKQERKIDLDFILNDITGLIKESIEGSARIRDIVQNLRNFARIDQVHSYSNTNINQGLESSLKLVWNELKYVAEVHKEFGNIPEILAHSGQLNQVFINILVNAAQAIAELKREQKSNIWIRTFQRDELVVVEIEDDGPGITETIRNRIYEPFFTTKEVGKGTGLGLNISYDIIVNKHHGIILCESELGQGTKFILKLPIVTERAQ